MSAELREKCGVGAVINSPHASLDLYFIGIAQNHRGQDSNGIFTTDGRSFYIQTQEGLVLPSFTEQQLKALKGTRGIVQNRYGTSGGKGDAHPQPVFREGDMVALGHNGTLSNPRPLEDFLDRKMISTSGLNDTEMMQRAVNYFLKNDASLEDALIEAYPYFVGAYSTVCATKNEIAGIRDECGIRPLEIGRRGNTTFITSETAAIDALETEDERSYVERDVRPGEIFIVNQHNEHKSIQIRTPRIRHDAVEYVYFARPDSVVNGRLVYQTRYDAGQILAEEHPVDVDMVIPVLSSSGPLAHGFANRLGIPYVEALAVNKYLLRNFISSGTNAEKDIRAGLKHNPMDSLIRGQRVALIDDSVVRGTTSGRTIDKVKRADPRELHVRIGSPTMGYPSFLGIDTAIQEDLIAFGKTVEEMRAHYDVNSLRFLSIEGLAKAIGIPLDQLDMSVFNGDYPIDIGDNIQRVKYLMYA